MNKRFFSLLWLVLPFVLSAQTFSRYDVNHDGKVTAADVALVVNAVVGKINYPVEMVSLSRTTASLTIGNTLSLTATVTPADADKPALTWQSSDTSVAIVSETGQVSAIAPGKCTITASATDGSNVQVSCQLTVSPIYVSSVALSKSMLTLTIGNSSTLTATVLPANATTPALTWTSSDPKVATVIDGKITTIAPGKCTITASATDGSGQKGICQLTVNPVFVSSLTLSASSLELDEDEEVTLTATLTPANATIKTLIWASSNTNVAIVTDGTITPKAEGTAIITASTTDGSGISAQCEVSVGMYTLSVTNVHAGRLDSTSPYLEFQDLRRQIKYLTISGPLNSSDIRLLRTMESLEVLDMRGASIVGGSSINYYDGGGTMAYWGTAVGAQTAQDNEFPAYFMKDSKLAKLHTLYMPNSVTVIPYGALWEAENLKHVYLGSSLETITILSFNCGIEEITIPKSVKTCMNTAFEKCYQLKNIYVEEGNQYMISIEGALYTKLSPTSYMSDYRLVCWPLAKKFNGFPTQFPTGGVLKEISSRCFSDCESLTSLVVPATVRVVGSAAFARCKNLRSLTLLYPYSSLDLGQQLFFESGEALEEIHLKTSTPPSRALSTSDGINLRKCKLYVPEGSGSKYRNDSYWRSFSIYEE